MLLIFTDLRYNRGIFCILGKAIDHVNMCRLYDAASSFTYLAVEFEVTELDEVEELDPLARLFEFARRARDLANEQQVITSSSSRFPDFGYVRNFTLQTRTTLGPLFSQSLSSSHLRTMQLESSIRSLRAEWTNHAI